MGSGVGGVRVTQDGNSDMMPHVRSPTRAVSLFVSRVLGLPFQALCTAGPVKKTVPLACTTPLAWQATCPWGGPGPLGGLRSGREAWPGRQRVLNVSSLIVQAFVPPQFFSALHNWNCCSFVVVVIAVLVQIGVNRQSSTSTSTSTSTSDQY